MTLEWLDAVKARRAAIGAAGWHVTEDIELWSVYDDTTGNPVVAEVGHADAEFIAHAPADVDRLIALAEAGHQLDRSFRGLAPMTFPQAWDQFRAALHDEDGVT